MLAPSTDEAAIRLLNRHGIEVVVAAGEACCGSLVHPAELATSTAVPTATMTGAGRMTPRACQIEAACIENHQKNVYGPEETKRSSLCTTARIAVAASIGCAPPPNRVGDLPTKNARPPARSERSSMPRSKVGPNAILTTHCQRAMTLAQTSRRDIE